MKEPRWKSGQMGWEIHVKTPMGEWLIQPHPTHANSDVWETYGGALGYARALHDLPEFRIMPAIDPFHRAIEPKWLWLFLAVWSAVLAGVASYIATIGWPT